MKQPCGVFSRNGFCPEKHIKDGYCRVYLDDVLIMSCSPDEHEKHLETAVTSLHERNFFCQLPKSDFALRELRYFRFLVTGFFSSISR
jgi:hypothetical protein